MNLLIILIVVLILLAAFGAPTWGYSRSWGYGWMPTYGFATLAIVLLILLLLGVIPGQTI